MSYFATHRSGRTESDLAPERFGDLLDELVLADSEHPDVALTHESEWSLAFYTSGAVVLENVETGEAMHMPAIDRSLAIALMISLAEGRIADVPGEEWRIGRR